MEVVRATLWGAKSLDFGAGVWFNNGCADLYLIIACSLFAGRGVGLVGRHEVFEEADVVFREESEVLHLVLQVRDTFYAHAECITFVNLGVDAACFEHVGVGHAATEDFNPSGVLAKTTTFAATDVARDVHFSRWLCEGEV